MALKQSLANIELLAPAGGMEQLQAAIRFGADAVYLAVDRFGMRARAENFTLDALDEAISYAHDNNVRVYVTCNTLMTPADIDALPEYLRALEEAGTDALVIGDMGAFALAREFAPHVALHVSTQASVANAAAAQAWYDLGARRIVCAREMSLADIARMRQDIPSDLEIEVFAHGAMCMAISGRCLISAYLTGRSANAGDCSQPCRWKYALEEENRPGEYFPIGEDERGTFILNAKDLNMIEHLDDLANAGVNSIKIEGRNKKAFYVAGVVNAYRHVLDGEDAAEIKDELLAVSHRPYGTGFYYGEAQQAADFEGYEFETLHVADVLNCELADESVLGYEPADEIVPDCELTDEIVPDCEPADANDNRRWVLTVRCRNRFEEGDELEVLRPHRAVAHIVVRNLEWLEQSYDKDRDCAENEKEPTPVAVANRACEHYRFFAEELDPKLSTEFDPTLNPPVQAGSFLRKRL